ncbi:nudix hydrolase 2-like [Telopea speciosissima]|uniref:nudix hydrolase 2-like n=1 Tax=Telopea speciosissima TaxID=54955 RepID=UPI001CC556E6|nr:nudix hydrolase 2-like [Telopea speciosissima]
MFRYFSRSSLLCFKSRSLRVSSNHSSLLSFPMTPGVQRKFRFSAVNSRLGVSEGLKDKPVNPLNIRYMSLSVSSSAVMGHVVSENGAQPVELLHGVADEFGGVIVDMKDPLDSEVFVATLRASMSKWRQEGKKGVWIKLPIELVNLVEASVKEGFRYHHAEAKYLMLVYWIPETPNTIPANASHRVGVGACVINDKREVLVVQEKSDTFGATGVWKFPTGVVDEGENICRAAVREVKEETGIDAEFVEVLAFRQSHQAFFGKSDLFFVCMLRPHSFDIQKQEVEIEAAQWMPIEDYAAQPFVQNHNLAKFLADICFSKIDKGYAGFSPVLTRSAFSEKPFNLYLNSCDLNQPRSSL